MSVESARRSRNKRMKDNPDLERERQRVWAKNWRDNNKEKARDIVRKYRNENKGKVADLAKKYKEQHPNRGYARDAARHAKHAGLITQKPCALCGHPETIGHHHDYNMPLSVAWLCRVHHAQIHQCLGVWTP